MKRIFTLLTISFLFSCSLDKNNQVKEDPIKYKFGYDQSKYIFEEKKVKTGDTFGDILEDQGIDYPEIFRALEKTKKLTRLQSEKFSKYGHLDFNLHPCLPFSSLSP